MTLIPTRIFNTVVLDDDADESEGMLIYACSSDFTTSDDPANASIASIVMLALLRRRLSSLVDCLSKKKSATNCVAILVLNLVESKSIGVLNAA